MDYIFAHEEGTIYLLVSFVPGWFSLPGNAQLIKLQHARESCYRVTHRRSRLVLVDRYELAACKHAFFRVAWGAWHRNLIRGISLVPRWRVWGSKALVTAVRKPRIMQVVIQCDPVACSRVFRSDVCCGCGDARAIEPIPAASVDMCSACLSSVDVILFDAATGCKVLCFRLACAL